MLAISRATGVLECMERRRKDEREKEREEKIYDGFDDWFGREH